MTLDPCPDVTAGAEPYTMTDDPARTYDHPEGTE